MMPHVSPASTLFAATHVFLNRIEHECMVDPAWLRLGCASETVDMADNRLDGSDSGSWSDLDIDYPVPGSNQEVVLEGANARNLAVARNNYGWSGQMFLSTGRVGALLLQDSMEDRHPSGNRMSKTALFPEDGMTNRCLQGRECRPPDLSGLRRVASLNPPSVLLGRRSRHHHPCNRRHPHQYR